MNLKRLLIIPLLLLILPAFAQEKVVTGSVTDSANNKSLAGVTVTATGTNVATATLNNGTFKLTVPANATTLTISSIGYGTQQVSIGNGTVNVSLAGTAGSLNEVVVIGYGTTKKKDLTGSVATVNEKDFQKGTITTPEQLIAGKVAGVQVISNGGAPGAGSIIRIRGGASLNASNDPLIVIDGIPLSGNGIAGVANQLAMINPNDIETFTILKDAASTAIYGSRASNGVILITTKKGRKGATRINFVTNFSV
ncbi:MAG: TonB-dependent receptor plug domain-containing protein, partial [Parafilimonas sp.]